MSVIRFLKTTLVFASLLVLPIVAFWLGWRVNEVWRTTRDCRSEGRLSQIRLALLLYHEEHGAFPPTKYQAKPGGPIHSWRVLLLPYTTLDYRERYSSYDFSQEWNSPSNLQALGGMPFFGYFNMNGDNDIAHYLAIGDEDDWPSRKPLRSFLVTKGKDRFLLVEYPESNIHWMEPRY